ncbi:MAG: cob(I)yrinic acid a,c-diamide adenosyltransferase [Archaeoglobi archaeon]|nr:cob(I)yrinic acid a,c-diamide adenosyltransferase [Archaeoglobi archaeon]TDA26029.1 MAG: cob(I)yrinic acid a,c-diamide adenosyltransferase [Archaeoglobi archaeon]TDA26335.1 MAG: cob(I)yrinic acid a,c-diamide adenosyltransferase [Archaeoglobi archaeon]TDA26359.1 MAG: cob(I)yrinic acid a,c-diamide adenosyltransferase [Archaeoglobi archaeon]
MSFGMTKTLSGSVFKDSAVAECLGAIDEANAFIGLAKVFSRDNEVRGILHEVQKRIFRIGEEFAGGRKVESSEIDWIKSKIKEMEEKIPKISSFVILEKDPATALLSVARAVVRRAERRAVTLYRNGLASENSVDWLNKLSYLLYLLTLKEGETFEEVQF